MTHAGFRLGTGVFQGDGEFFTSFADFGCSLVLNCMLSLDSTVVAQLPAAGVAAVDAASEAGASAGGVLLQEQVRLQSSRCSRSGGFGRF